MPGGRTREIVCLTTELVVVAVQLIDSTDWPGWGDRSPHSSDAVNEFHCARVCVCVCVLAVIHDGDWH